jgi:hypothetical protein
MLRRELFNNRETWQTPTGTQPELLMVLELGVLLRHDLNGRLSGG